MPKYDSAPKTITIMKQEKTESDWKEVLVDIILKIITLGLYHVEKHKKQ